MPDSADEYQIKVSVDASGVGSGVDTTVEGLKQIKTETGGIGEAADDASEKTSKLTEELGGMRESQRVAHDLYDIIAGAGEGSLAGGIQGATGLLRVFLATSEGFNPIFLAFTIVGAALAGIVAQHEKVKGSAAESKKAEEDLGEASKDASEKRIAAIGRVVDAFGGLMQSEDNYHDALDREAGYYQKAIEDTEKLIAARTKLAVAELEHQRQIALGNAKSKDDVDAINERYKNLIEGVENQSNADILQKKVQGSAQDIADKVGDQNRVKEELGPVQDELQSHRDATAQAQQAATAAGVLPDAAGSYAEIRKELGKQLDGLVQESKARPYDSGISEQVYEVGKKSQAANRADDYTQGLAKWEALLDPAIDKLTKKFDDLGSAIDRAKTDNQILQTEQATAAQTAQTKALADQQAQLLAAATGAYENQRAQLEARVKEQETQQSNPSLSADQKTAGRASIEGLQAQIAQLQLDNARILNLSDAEKIGLRSDVKTDKEKAVFDLGGGQQRDQSQQDKTDARDVGQEAEGAVLDLNPSKAQGEEARQALHQMEQGHAAGARQLEVLLDNIVHGTKGLTDAQIEAYGKIFDRLRVVERTLSDHQHTMRNLANSEPGYH
jgi:hypothetical protein